MKRKSSKSRPDVIDAVIVEHSECSSVSAARHRRIERLRACFEIDAFAGEIIVELLERIERMDRDLDRLRGLTEQRHFIERRIENRGR